MQPTIRIDRDVNKPQDSMLEPDSAFTTTAVCPTRRLYRLLRRRETARLACFL